MTNDTASLRPFEADLLPMLVEVARDIELAPQPPLLALPARRWRRFALVTAAAISLALVVPLLSDDPLRGALAIDQRGDTIYVSVKDAAADPEAMTNDLRAHGLPAHVEVIPVSPSLEGAWVDIVNDNLAAGYNDPRISDVFRQIEKRPKVLELPADFSTPFTLGVGRRAQPGETYIIATDDDALDAYACLGLEGLTPAQAKDEIAARGYEALWYYERSDMPYTEVLDAVPTDKVITGASFLGPTTVIVYAADPDSQHVREMSSASGDPADC